MPPRRPCQGVDPHILLTHIASGKWPHEYARYHQMCLDMELRRLLNGRDELTVCQESPIAKMRRADNSHFTAHPDGSIFSRGITDKSDDYQLLFPPDSRAIPGLPILEPKPENAQSINEASLIHDPQLGIAILGSELASASNELGEDCLRCGDHYNRYWEKHMGYQRLPITYLGINLNPFLHPIGMKPPYYPAKGAFPFNVLTWTGHPDDPSKGSTLVHSWRFGERAPRIPVPLRGTNGITLDLEVVHQMMFERLWQTADYTHKPPMWEHLESGDRQWLAAYQERLPLLMNQEEEYHRSVLGLDR